MLGSWLSRSRFYKTLVCWETRGLTAKKAYNCFKVQPCLNIHTLYIRVMRAVSRFGFQGSPFHGSPPHFLVSFLCEIIEETERCTHPEWGCEKNWAFSQRGKNMEGGSRTWVVHALQTKCCCSELSQGTSTSSDPSWWFWNLKWPYLSRSTQLSQLNGLYSTILHSWETLLAKSPPHFFFRWLGRDSSD